MALMATDTLEAPRVLTALDRCDRCRGQAYVRGTMAGGGAVHLCRHHGIKHMTALRKQCVSVLDESRFCR